MPKEFEVNVARGVLHVTVGDEDWDPTEEQMSQLSELFRSAAVDPLGQSVVVTCVGVETKSHGETSRVVHVVAGSPDWTPTAEDMDRVATSMMEAVAERHPLTFTLPVAKAERIRHALLTMRKQAQENVDEAAKIPPGDGVTPGGIVRAAAEDDLHAWDDAIVSLDDAIAAHGRT